jgi:hypothetical protein
VGVKNVEKDRALVNILNVLDLLGDVLRSGTDTSDREKDVVLEEIPGEHLDVAREGSGKHQGLALSDTRHILALNNSADLGLETHVKHSISLIEHKILDVAKGDATSLYEINQSTGSSNQKIATALDLTQLRADVGTTIDDTGSDPRSVGELAGLLVDLRN